MSSKAVDDYVDVHIPELTYSETYQLVNTLYLNIVICLVLAGFFEVNRHYKSVYLKRLTRKFERSKRVPPAPRRYPFGWVPAILAVKEGELVRMVGLDGYMLIRYINICLKMSAFLTFYGLFVLSPLYATAQGSLPTRFEWSTFTIANIPTDSTIDLLWVPAFFAYIFTAYFCLLMYREYKNFVQKRIQYLIKGDPDTPPQTYYTIAVERLPGCLRSERQLVEFFEKLFPGQVHSVEIALDISELDTLTVERRSVRNKLEKEIAVLKASGRRPSILVSADFYRDLPDPLVPLPTSPLCLWLGYSKYDSIDHHYHLLRMLNENVSTLQQAYFEQSYGAYNDPDSNSGIGVNEQRGSRSLTEQASPETDSDSDAHGIFNRLLCMLERFKSSSEQELYDVDSRKGGRADSSDGDNHTRSSVTNTMVSMGVQMVSKAAIVAETMEKGVEDLANAGISTAKIATKGALKGMLEATRTLELLTVGAYYKTSSTAFVTLTSRLAACSSSQMLLSHEHCTLKVSAAPNPKDIILENISIPQRQVSTRRSIADLTLFIGAIFWSFVVGFIATISNLESISKEHGWEWIQYYNKTSVYIFLNNYLALGLLLTLLAGLPAIFDVISRNYEGLKLESEIQNSIMTRYFYYQLANVFVSVGLGSIAGSLHQILNRPSSIFRILGASVPSFSTYFANLLIVKTFTAVPIEMLRLWPLFEILSVKCCMDRKKCTRRELRTGAFADPPMLYGWIYPNLLMVLMIMQTYCCIAPLLMPFSTLFYALAYAMYKYQLLYVYVNDYQSGGFMWYAVFTHSMVGLICGVIALICYLGILETPSSGPFYSLMPLPLCIVFFWRYCEGRFKEPSLSLSLESAIDIDRAIAQRSAAGKRTPLSSFSKSLFRQDSLVEGPLKPAAYRKRSLEEVPVREELPWPRDAELAAPVEDEEEDDGEADTHVNEILDHTPDLYDVPSPHRPSLLSASRRSSVESEYQSLRGSGIDGEGYGAIGRN